MDKENKCYQCGGFGCNHCGVPAKGSNSALAAGCEAVTVVVADNRVLGVYSTNKKAVEAIREAEEKYPNSEIKQWRCLVR